jgi:transposase
MIREILRLYYHRGLSQKKISTALGCARSSVGEYIRRARTAGLSWPLPAELDDEDLLEKHIFGPPPEKQKAQPDCASIHIELKRKGVTLELLWHEYKELNPDGYQQTQFCNIYRNWRKTAGLVMRQEHKAGQKAFSDFAGTTLPITNPGTGEVTQAHLFVCALGASSYTYARLFSNETSESWCNGHAYAFSFFQGCPEIVVPDNPRPVVTKASPYEPDVNPSFAQMANHFDVAVIPARVRKPKDKAVVEAAVGLATRWILAALRNRTFFSLGEANDAVKELLIKLNSRPFKKMPGSRISRFQELDKPALQALPKEPYEFVQIKYASVNIADYHVQFDGCWYSAPFHYRGRQVEVRASTRTVEIFLRGKRIASHARHINTGKTSTLKEHRPQHHQDYGEWPPERLVRWAAQIGSFTKLLVERLLSETDHPEQAYRRCFGVLRLAKSVGNDRLNAAAARALAINACSLKSVQSILNAGLEGRPLPEKPRQLTIIHENIRGKNSFISLVEGESKNVN